MTSRTTPHAGPVLRQIAELAGLGCETVRVVRAAQNSTMLSTTVE